jgi:hypothetical protein
METMITEREAMRRNIRQKIGAHLYQRARAIKAELADLCPYAHRYSVATARGHLNEVEKLRAEIAALIDGAFSEERPRVPTWEEEAVR